MKDVRKTVTFNGELVEAINKIRGKALINNSKDLNFTDVVNMLVKLGLEKLSEST